MGFGFDRINKKNSGELAVVSSSFVFCFCCLLLWNGRFFFVLCSFKNAWKMVKALTDRKWEHILEHDSLAKQWFFTEGYAICAWKTKQSTKKVCENIPKVCDANFYFPSYHKVKENRAYIDQKVCRSRRKVLYQTLAISKKTNMAKVKHNFSSFKGKKKQ